MDLKTKFLSKIDKIQVNSFNLWIKCMSDKYKRLINQAAVYVIYGAVSLKFYLKDGWMITSIYYK
jgi:hypothetical protein